MGINSPRQTIRRPKHIENPKDELLNCAIDNALKNKNLSCNKNKPFIVNVSDSYRYVLLKHYGGIYLDCDTFPVRPFDDSLLDHTEFDVTISWGINQFIVRDVFFKNCYWKWSKY